MKMMMNRILGIIAVMIFVVNTTAMTLQAQSAPDAAELTKLLKEFLAGAGRNDAAVHDLFWAEDLIYTRSSGVRTNKPDLMKGVRSAPAAKPGDPVTVYTAEDIRIQQYGDTAVVAFKLIGASTKSYGTKTVSNHLNTVTFVKRNGKWQVVAWQSTVVPAPQPTASPQSSAAATPLKSTTGKLTSETTGKPPIITFRAHISKAHAVDVIT